MDVSHVAQTVTQICKRMMLWWRQLKQLGYLRNRWRTVGLYRFSGVAGRDCDGVHLHILDDI